MMLAAVGRPNRGPTTAAARPFQLDARVKFSMNLAAVPVPSDEAPLRDLLFRLMPAFFDEPRVEAVWVEGEPCGARPRLASPLDLHVAAPEPVFDSLLRDLPAILARRLPSVSVTGPGPADFEGKSFRFRSADGVDVALTVERTALVGKRPRRAILPQMDRSGLLRYTVDVRG
jgi:hypothetical protein